MTLTEIVLTAALCAVSLAWWWEWAASLSALRATRAAVNKARQQGRDQGRTETLRALENGPELTQLIREIYIRGVRDAYAAWTAHNQEPPPKTTVHFPQNSRTQTPT